MKNLAILLLCSLFVFSLNAFAQDDGGVSIGKNGDQANAKSILELVSKTKGLLIPRMTTVERLAIFSVADPTVKIGALSLLVFDTDTKSFQYWNGADWKDLGGNSGTAIGTVIAKATPPDPLVNPVYFNTANNSFRKFNSLSGDWDKVASTFHIGTIAPVGSSVGEAFYNTATNSLSVYDGSAWAAVSIPDATSTALGKIQLAGDLTGTAAAPRVVGLVGKAPLDSPIFTGTPKLPTGTEAVTQAPNDNSTKIATTAFVLANSPVTPDATSTALGKIQLAGDLAGTAAAPTVPGLATKASLASPSFSGVPLAPTATPGTNTDQIATTKFVLANSAITPDATPAVLGKIQLTGDLGGTAAAPTVPGLATKAPSASPSFSGIPLAPTATPGTNTDQIATTKFVTAAVGGALNVTAEQTGNYTALATDDIILYNATSTGLTLTLPTIGISIGKRYYVSNRGSASVDISPLPRELQTQNLPMQSAIILMYVGNSSWSIISGY